MHIFYIKSKLTVRFTIFYRYLYMLIYVFKVFILFILYIKNCWKLHTKLIKKYVIDGLYLPYLKLYLRELEIPCNSFVCKA